MIVFNIIFLVFGYKDFRRILIVILYVKSIILVRWFRWMCKDFIEIK